MVGLLSAWSICVAASALAGLAVVGVWLRLDRLRQRRAAPKPQTREYMICQTIDTTGIHPVAVYHVLTDEGVTVCPDEYAAAAEVLRLENLHQRRLEVGRLRPLCVMAW